MECSLIGISVNQKVFEYQRQTYVCECCSNLQASEWPEDIIPGQDLGVRLQAFLGWTNNYAHMPMVVFP